MSIRALYAAIATLMLTACVGGKPTSYFVGTPRPKTDAYSCALSKVSELGYSVTNSNAESGFIAATKVATGSGTKLLVGHQYSHVLNVSVVDDGTAARRIRAIASYGREGYLVGPSDAGKADVNALLQSCGAGPITTQTQ